MSLIKEIEIKQDINYFKLKNVLHNKNISINKLMRNTETDFKDSKRLMTGDLVIIDILVLARLCNYLECDLIDIIDYKTIKKI